MPFLLSALPVLNNSLLLLQRSFAGGLELFRHLLLPLRLPDSLADYIGRTSRLCDGWCLPCDGWRRPEVATVSVTEHLLACNNCPSAPPGERVASPANHGGSLHQAEPVQPKGLHLPWWRREHLSSPVLELSFKSGIVLKVTPSLTKQQEIGAMRHLKVG